MKQRIEDKINHVRDLAKTSVKSSNVIAGKDLRANDSLSQVVRNSQEANIFLDELNTAIKISNKK